MIKEDIIGKIVKHADYQDRKEYYYLLTEGKYPDQIILYYNHTSNEKLFNKSATNYTVSECIHFINKGIWIIPDQQEAKEFLGIIPEHNLILVL